MAKKILFLDFDGVMVTEKYQIQLMTSNSPLRDSYGTMFDPVCVECLKQIVNSTDAAILVTSTWKMEMGLDGIQEMWSGRSLPGKVIGVTPDIDPIHRGKEIDAWLKEYRVACRYAIIDDTPFTDFFLDEQLQFLFQVDERTGIDEKTVKQVVKHLNSDIE